jgi:hypothetical protein
MCQGLEPPVDGRRAECGLSATHKRHRIGNPPVFTGVAGKYVWAHELPEEEEA